MLGDALTVRFSDPDHFREYLQGWDTRPIQLGAGQLRVDWSGVDLGGFVLSRLAVNRKVADISTVDDGMLTFVVCLGSKLWCGNEVEPGSLVVFDSSRDYRNVLEPNWVSIEIWASIDQMVGEGLPVDTFLARDRGLRVFPLPRELIRQYCSLAELAFSPDIGHIRLQPIEWLAFRATTLQLLAKTAAYIEAPGFETVPLRSRNGYRLTTIAMEFIERNHDCRLEVGDVAENLKVSPRALHYAFNQVLGISTYNYMLAHRLNAARRALRRLPVRPSTVTEVAMKNDFHHLSRFSTHYHRMFGELPSRTLYSRESDTPATDV